MPLRPARLFFLCLLLAKLAPASPSWGAGEQLTPDQWREDLETLDEAIRSDHKSPFHTVSEEDYTARIRALHDAIPTISDQAIIVEMAAIVASINDGHTRLTGWHRNASWGFNSYPVALYWFQDGLFVRQAHPDHADLVGARILRIGEFDAEEAQSRIEHVVAADNIYGEKAGGPHYLISPEVMQVLGILVSGDRRPYLLEKAGKTWRPEIEPLSGAWPGWTRGFIPSDENWTDAKDQAGTPPPLWRRHVDKTFWFEYVEDAKLLYVQQNQVRNDHEESLESFYGRVWEVFTRNEVEKLVLDLRLNGGGNNYLNKPALTTMVRADASAQTFTIIGRQTFSACQNLVNELSRWTDTVFVGEPTGERVNFYGDTKTTELPHSGLSVRASWLWWQNLDPRDSRDALYPDLATELSFEDYATNHDPAMAAIHEFQDLLTEDAMIGLIDAEGLPAAESAFRAAIHDPLYRHRDMEAEINALGYRLLGEHRIEDAIAVFQLNVAQFPDSWNAYDSLAEAHEDHGNLEIALDLFRKSLSMNPTSPTGLAAVERLENQLAPSASHQD